VGRGPLARGGMQKWLGAVARAPPVKDVPNAFRARAGCPPAMLDASPGGFVSFDPLGAEHRPLPPGACQTRQGLVRPAFAVTPQASPGSPPGQECGSNAAG